MPTAEIKDYSFHGVAMTQVEFGVALAKRNDGQCPFCNRHFKAQYGAINKHIRACARKHQLTH